MTEPETSAAPVEIEIARLGRHGDGVDAAGALFAPLTLPGERISGILAGDRIEAPAILSASPDRVAAPCPQFGACGGCALQHASDAFVAAWKRERVIEALAARGLATEVRATATSPARSRRRATFSARRTRTSAIVGFHERRESRLSEVPDCLVLDPALLAGVEALRALVVAGAGRRGEMKLAVAVTDSGLDVDVRGGRALDAGLRVDLAAAAAEQGLARLSWEGETVAAPNPPAVTIGLARPVLPPGAFLQATREGEATLAAAVEEAMGPVLARRGARVADLFCGLGTFALRLAEKADVLAVESDKAMIAALAAAWRGAGGRLHRIDAQARDLFRRPLLPVELKGIDALVFDPPRAGAKAQAEALARAPLTRIAAVSCNPETFARDARALVDGGWRLDWVLPVDQFRWSAHVELAAAFSRP